MSVAPLSEKDASAEVAVISLHNRETSASGYWGHPGIATVTFCRGNREEALAALRPRVSACLRVNPWIAGQLNKKKQLVYARDPADALVDELLSPAECPGLSRSTKYADLVKVTGGNADLTVQGGAKLWKSGGRVAKLVVAELDGQGNEFALIFSMSHVAADGHDYYRILNMIAGTAPVASLDPVRVAEYEKRESEWTGRSDFKWLSSFGLVKGMLSGYLFGPKSRWVCMEIDEEKVQRAKSAAVESGAVPFVSTNDIVTSHFANASNARVAMMVINMRDKIPTLQLGDDHAGCYEACLLLDPDNYAVPAGIRACLARKEPPYTRATQSKLPGVCGSCPMAFITNWASFAWTLDTAALDIEEQLLHLPCMDMPDCMDVAIVFQSRPGKLAVIYLAKRATPDKLMKHPLSILGKSVEPGIFLQ